MAIDWYGIYLDSLRGEYSRIGNYSVYIDVRDGTVRRCPVGMERKTLVWEEVPAPGSANWN